jgi:hypothetical protein
VGRALETGDASDLREENRTSGEVVEGALLTPARGDAPAELPLQVVERPDHQNRRIRLPVPGEIAGEDEAVRRVERAGGLIAVGNLVGAIARRNGQDEEELPTLLPGVTRYAVKQRPSNPSSSAVGADRHPRDLQAFVKPLLKRQKPHNLAPVLGDDPPFCPNRAAGTRFRRRGPLSLARDDVRRAHCDDRRSGSLKAAVGRADARGMESS